MDLSSEAFEATRKRLLARFAGHAVPWWDRLPQTLEKLALQWALDLEEPVGRGNTSLLLRCRDRHGRAAILKLSPEVELVRAEATALRRWAPSHHVPAVWLHDASHGALLLEALPIEAPLAELSDNVAIDDVAELIDALHRTGAADVGGGVVALADRVDFMFAHFATRIETPTVVSPEQIRRGYELARALAGDSVRPVLLHGDLHPFNVLDGGAGRGLVAIDPRPCVGDRAFDAVDWVIWPRDDPANWRPRCAHLGEALGVDPERIWDWCRTFAAMLAETTASRDHDADRVDAYLGIAP